MCGIVGVITSEGFIGAKKRSAFFETALNVDNIRGQHSTGYFRIDDDGDIITKKKAMNSLDFLELRSIQNDLRNDNVKAIIGHNRHATMGSHTNRNAHPFVQGKITGVHNGTLYPGWKNYLQTPNHIDVDSEGIFYAINEQGYEDVIQKLDGAFTLVWQDNEDKVVRLVRNKERPIAVAKVKNEKTFLIASEKLMLVWLAARSGLLLDDVVEPEPGMMMEFPNDNPVEFTARKLELKKFYAPTKSKYQHGGKGGRKGGNGGIIDNVTPIKSYAYLGIERTKDYEYYGHYFKPYKKDSKLGYLLGKNDHFRVNENKESLTCIVHNINLEELMKELKVEEVQDIIIEGKAAGLSTQQSNSGTPFVLLDMASTQFTGIEYDDEEEFVVPKGKVNKKEYQKLIEQGCCMCGDPIDINEHEDVTWIEGNFPVCPSPSCKASSIYEGGNA